jgi:guanylate kinase
MSGKAVIITAPSGAGKTTIVRHLLQTYPQLAFSVSATTRPKRPEEVHGRDYYFLSENTFKSKIANNEFLEWEEVYEGCFYGTLASEVERLNNEGKTVIFDVDVKGALRLKEKFGNQALSIFIKAPSFQVMVERLKSRATENEAELQKRIERMQYEMTFENRFDVTIINDKLDKTLQDAENIIGNFLNNHD